MIYSEELSCPVEGRGKSDGWLSSFRLGTFPGSRKKLGGIREVRLSARVSPLEFSRETEPVE